MLLFCGRLLERVAQLEQAAQVHFSRLSRAPQGRAVVVQVSLALWTMRNLNELLCTQSSVQMVKLHIWQIHIAYVPYRLVVAVDKHLDTVVNGL